MSKVIYLVGYKILIFLKSRSPCLLSFLGHAETVILDILKLEWSVAVASPPSSITTNKVRFLVKIISLGFLALVFLTYALKIIFDCVGHYIGIVLVIWLLSL